MTAVTHKPRRFSLSSIASESERWKHYWKGVLHQLTGDDVAAYLGIDPSISIKLAPRPNAYSISPNRVVISSGLLDLVETRAEFAFVLAHELAHVVLHHTDGLAAENSAEPMIRREMDADAFAIKLLKEGGFDPEAALSILSKLRQFGSENGALLEHAFPSLSVRFRALDNSINRSAKVLG